MTLTPEECGHVAIPKETFEAVRQTLGKQPFEQVVALLADMNTKAVLVKIAEAPAETPANESK
jgi:hypothetical protein